MIASDTLHIKIAYGYTTFSVLQCIVSDRKWFIIIHINHMVVFCSGRCHPIQYADNVFILFRSSPMSVWRAVFVYEHMCRVLMQRVHCLVGACYATPHLTTQIWSLVAMYACMLIFSFEYPCTHTCSKTQCVSNHTLLAGTCIYSCVCIACNSLCVDAFFAHVFTAHIRSTYCSFTQLAFTT